MLILTAAELCIDDIVKMCDELIDTMDLYGDVFQIELKPEVGSLTGRISKGLNGKFRSTLFMVK